MSRGDSILPNADLDETGGLFSGLPYSVAGEVWTPLFEPFDTASRRLTNIYLYGYAFIS